jgi:hypothetical protein
MYGNAQKLGLKGGALGFSGPNIIPNGHNLTAKPLVANIT